MTGRRHMERLSSTHDCLPRTYVPRPRLIQKLLLATQRKLTIVCANAGYGKTTLLRDFTQSAGLRAEWYQLSPTDRDVAQLAEHLLVVLRRLSNDVPARSPRRARLRGIEAPDAGALSRILQRQAERVGPEAALLVLDDYQAVDQVQDAHLLLGSLVENSPPSIHFVVLSRSIPRLPLARLRVRQELVAIAEDELAFTLDETAQFLKGDGDFGLSDAEIALVHERSEGWAAGIAMVSQSLRYGSQAQALTILSDPAASARLAYDYLAEEVFDRQERSIQSFLVKTSVLRNMSVPMVDYVLDTNSSRQTLLQLEEKGLFTTSVDASRQTFRYHQLFRDFLREKLYLVESPDAVRVLHVRAAEFCERSEQWEGCVEHLLQAGEYPRAAEVVERVGARYLRAGFAHTVDYWLKAFPESVRVSRPWFYVLRAQLSELAVRYDDALWLLERALRLFQASGDEVGQAWTTDEIAFVRYKSGQIQYSVRHFTSALAAATAGSPLRARILFSLAVACRDAGILDDSARASNALLEEAASIDDESTRLWNRSRASRNLAFTLMEMGRLSEALRTARESLAFCANHPTGDYEESWATAVLGAISWAGGDLDEAERAFNRAFSLSGRSIRYLEHFIGLWLGNTLRDAGRYAEAEQAYDRSAGVAELERLFLASLERRQDIKPIATDLYKQFHLSENVADRGTAEVVMSVLLHQSHETEKALEHVREGVRLFKEHEYRHRAASALLRQASMEYELLRPSAARATLAEALELASTEGYFHFFWWDSAMIANLCRLALAEDVFSDYVTQLIGRHLGDKAMGVLAPLLADKRADVRRRLPTNVSFRSERLAPEPDYHALAACKDPQVQASLCQAVEEDIVSLTGIRSLRDKYGLSWREVEVFVDYYLRRTPDLTDPEARLREECAKRLSISEHTVRCHVNSIRGKLALSRSVSGRMVRDWAQKERLLPTVAAAPYST